MKNSLERFGLAAGLISLGFAVPLCRLFRFAWGSELFSYIPLIPLVSVYLAWTFKAELPAKSAPMRLPAMFSWGAAIAALAGYFVLARGGGPAALQDSLTLGALGWLLGVAGAGWWCLGGATMRTLAYPIALLLFMIPFPLEAQDALESFLQYGSAEAADWLFVLTGTPVLRSGLDFQLSTITLHVAPECSGIHSTWVLLITSVVAGRLILCASWNRFWLCLVVLPLALLRNGFRVFTLGQLCIHIGPQMIDSPIHHRGGPLFFVLSLVPFFGLLYWLKRRERAHQGAKPA